MLEPGLFEQTFWHAETRRGNKDPPLGGPYPYTLRVKLALIFPPACDPTAPYPAVAALTGFLRPQGVDVMPIDANLEGFLALLQREALTLLCDRIERRIASLQRRRALDHQSQLELLTLLRVRGEADTVPAGIGAALDVLRSRERFYHPGLYADAVTTVSTSLRVIAAAHAPMQLDFTAYRTPFALTTPDEIARDADPERDPFDGYLMRELVPRLRRARVDAIGLSVCFPGQLVPAYSFALKLKAALPEAHLVAGGPAITQVLLRLRGRALAQGLGAFDSAVVYEGEHTLLAVCRALAVAAPRRRLPESTTWCYVIPCWGRGFCPGRPLSICAPCPRPTSTACRLLAIWRRICCCPTIPRAAVTGAAAPSATTAWPQPAPPATASARWTRWSSTSPLCPSATTRASSICRRTQWRPRCCAGWPTAWQRPAWICAGALTCGPSRI